MLRLGQRILCAGILFVDFGSLVLFRYSMEDGDTEGALPSAENVDKMSTLAAVCAPQTRKFG